MTLAAKSTSSPAAPGRAAGAGSLPSGPGSLAGRRGASAVPWEIWGGALAVTLSIVGLEWDIAWHSSIGRDRFWTPAHMLIYLCGVITAVVSGYLVLSTTFGGRGRAAERRTRAVGIFGLRAPLGAFVAAWGGLAMLVSAPFDDWWHSAYGLDVEVLSPPHILLFFGLAMIASGFLLVAAGAMNQAAGVGGAGLGWVEGLFLYLGGLNLMMYMIIFEQRTEIWQLHNAGPYKTLAAFAPFVLAVLGSAARSGWGATAAVGVYSAIRIAAIQILPLFAATPKLGPVYTPVTHLIPAEFPILLVVPAMVLDLWWRHAGGMRLWLRGVLSGLLFTAALVAAEWPFANFLVSKWAANRFFGTLYVGYATHVADRAPHLAGSQSGWPLAHGLLVAAAMAVCASWPGLAVGRWMREVQR
ncbi:MAG TPA: hypothetical protein VGD62_05410 [Acidobacteriaceae bacterium]